MRNEKWEMRKWGNGKNVHCISFSELLTFCLILQSSRESQCPCMHSPRVALYPGSCRRNEPGDEATERSSLPDSWHQRGMQRHCITVCKLILCISSSLWQLVSRFLKFVESMNCPYFVPTSYKEPF